MVLNQDGTLDMYNIKGQRAAGWLGIAPEEKATGLPTYTTRGNNGYWVVSSADKTTVYPFNGGEPVVSIDGHVPAEQIDIQ